MIRRYLASLAVLAAAAAPVLAQPGMDRGERDRPGHRETMPRERGPEMDRGERGPRGPKIRERIRERHEAIRERGDRLDRDEGPQVRRERRHFRGEGMHDRRGEPGRRFDRDMRPDARERTHHPRPHRRGPMARGGDEAKACPHCGGPLDRPEARMHRDRDVRPMGPAPRSEFRGPDRPHGRRHVPGQGRDGMDRPRLKEGDRFEGRFRRPMEPMRPMRRGPVGDDRPL